MKHLMLAAAVAFVAFAALAACAEDDAPAPSTALGTDGAASCVEGYDLETLAHRAFAFDGTVVQISDGSADTRSFGYVDVTFDVNEWFRSSAADQTIVEMNPPLGETSTISAGYQVTSYEVGSRLLVTGEPRWGGEPLDNAIAWYCGFTRTHDEETATAWRNALR